MICCSPLFVFCFRHYLTLSPGDCKISPTPGVTPRTVFWPRTDLGAHHHPEPLAPQPADVPQPRQHWGPSAHRNEPCLRPPSCRATAARASGVAWCWAPQGPGWSFHSCPGRCCPFKSGIGHRTIL